MGRDVASALIGERLAPRLVKYQYRCCIHTANSIRRLASLVSGYKSAWIKGQQYTDTEYTNGCYIYSPQMKRGLLCYGVHIARTGSLWGPISIVI